MIYRLIALCAFSLGFSAPPGQNASPPETATAEAIVQKALERAEAQYQSMVEASFESDVVATTKSLDAGNRVTGTNWNRRRQYPLSGALFEEIVEKNGRPLSDRERRQEEKKRKDFVREVAKRRARGEHPQPEKEPGIRFNHDFVSRYKLKKAGAETVGGHDCWVIAFEPGDGKLPVRNRMDQALNHSTGKLWISRDDFGLARIEFALRKPFKYWGGFLAVIRNTDGRLDYRRLEPDLWVPTDFDLKLDLEVLMLKDIRRHITIRWSDYRRSDGGTRRPEAAGLNPPAQRQAPNREFVRAGALRRRP